MNVNLSNFYSTSVSTSLDGFDGSAEAEVKQILKIGAVKRDTRKYDCIRWAFIHHFLVTYETVVSTINKNEYITVIIK